MIKIIPKGHIQDGKTIITFPFFEESHLEFFKKYFTMDKMVISLNKLIIHDMIEMKKIEEAIYAYQYEFGEW